MTRKKRKGFQQTYEVSDRDLQSYYSRYLPQFQLGGGAGLGRVLDKAFSTIKGVGNNPVNKLDYKNTTLKNDSNQSGYFDPATGEIKTWGDTMATGQGGDGGLNAFYEAQSKIQVPVGTVYNEETGEWDKTDKTTNLFSKRVFNPVTGETEYADPTGERTDADIANDRVTKLHGTSFTVDKYGEPVSYKDPEGEWDYYADEDEFKDRFKVDPGTTTGTTTGTTPVTTTGTTQGDINSTYQAHLDSLTSGVKQSTNSSIPGFTSQQELNKQYEESLKTQRLGGAIPRFQGGGGDDNGATYEFSAAGGKEYQGATLYGQSCTGWKCRPSPHNIYTGGGISGGKSPGGYTGNARLNAGYSMHDPNSPLTGHLGVNANVRGALQGLEGDFQDSSFSWDPSFGVSGSLGLEGAFGPRKNRTNLGGGLYFDKQLGADSNTLGAYLKFRNLTGSAGYNPDTGWGAKLGVGFPLIRKTGGAIPKFQGAAGSSELNPYSATDYLLQDLDNYDGRPEWTAEQMGRGAIATQSLDNFSLEDNQPDELSSKFHDLKLKTLSGGDDGHNLDDADVVSNTAYVPPINIDLQTIEREEIPKELAVPSSPAAPEGPSFEDSTSVTSDWGGGMKGLNNRANYALDYLGNSTAAAGADLAVAGATLGKEYFKEREAEAKKIELQSGSTADSLNLVKDADFDLSKGVHDVNTGMIMDSRGTPRFARLGLEILQRGGTLDEAKAGVALQQFMDIAQPNIAFNQDDILAQKQTLNRMRDGGPHSLFGKRRSKEAEYLIDPSVFATEPYSLTNVRQNVLDPKVAPEFPGQTLGAGSWQAGEGYVPGLESKLSMNQDGLYTRRQVESYPWDYDGPDQILEDKRDGGQVLDLDEALIQELIAAGANIEIL